MNVIASENVQHGFTNSWIDYDRAWFFREYLRRTSHQKPRTKEDPQGAKFSSQNILRQF